MESGFKVSEFAGRIQRMGVDERRIRKEKYTDSKVSGYVWTMPDFRLSNLVPRAFPLMVGGAVKGPGIGWSRVHLTP